MNKYTGKGIGYVLGVFIVIPVTIAIVNFLFFRGNQVTQKQVSEYINDSRIVEIFIPRVGLERNMGKDIEKDRTKLESESYHPKLTRGNNTKSIYRFIFYSEKYNKYMMLINFDGFDYGDPFNHDRNDERNKIVLSGNYFLVRANNKQWNDVNYGSEANPVPVFGITLSGRGYEKFSTKMLERDKILFDVSEQINRIFVEQYLDHFLPHDAYKKLFAIS